MPGHVNLFYAQFLVLNFVNDYTVTDVLAHAQTVAHAVGQSSRYHGDKELNAAVFLDCHV